MRAIVAVLAAWAWCVSATAQTPAEDGLGPYRFGMSMDAVRATAPNAAWRAERVSDHDTLTSGRLATIGPARFSTLLAFEENELVRIVLMATSPMSCADVVPAIVEELEPTYGAFRSAPALNERGIVASLRRTDAGSELRFRDRTVDELASVHATQRRAGMLVVVSGEQDAAEPVACRMSVSFDRRLITPPPEYRALFERIELAETAMMEWATRPQGADFARHYPLRALQSGVGGIGVLDCIVLESGRLDCLPAFETPIGAGFGQASVRISESFRADISGENASKVGKRVRIDLRFSVG